MKNLLERLQEKYPEYFIQEISEKDLILDAKEQFISINITPHIKEDGSIGYKLRRKSKDNVFIYTNWCKDSETVVNNLLNDLL